VRDGRRMDSKNVIYYEKGGKTAQLYDDKSQDSVVMDLEDARRYRRVVSEWLGAGNLFNTSINFTTERQLLDSLRRSREDQNRYKDVLVALSMLGHDHRAVLKACRMPSLVNAEWRKVWPLCLRLGMQVKDTDSQWENVEKFLCYSVGKADVPDEVGKAAQLVAEFIRKRSSIKDD
jgi:hypothetical protein